MNSLSVNNNNCRISEVIRKKKKKILNRPTQALTDDGLYIIWQMAIEDIIYRLYTIRVCAKLLKDKNRIRLWVFILFF